MRIKLIQVINYINLIACLLWAATAIYYYPIQRIAVAVFFLSYFFEFILEKKWQQVKFDKKRLYFIVMATFFFLALLYFPFEQNTRYFGALIGKRTTLLGFAIVGFFGVNSKFKLSYFLNTFIVSSIIAILYLIFYRIGISDFFSNPLRIDVFSEERIKYVNTHMSFNFYLNISLLGIWYILTQSWSRIVWWEKGLYICAVVINVGILSISEGRSGFLVGILVLLCVIFLEVWKRKKTLGIILGLLVPFLLVGLVSQHKRMSEDKLKSEPRLFLWKSALTVIKEKPVFGYGISTAQAQFDVARTKYQTEEFRLGWINASRLDCHNQYLQTSMELGILGLLFLLFIYLYPIYLADKNRKLMSVFVLFLCAFQSVFDMFITGRFIGIFGILIILLLLVDDNIVLDNSKKTKVV